MRRSILVGATGDQAAVGDDPPVGGRTACGQVEDPPARGVKRSSPADSSLLVVHAFRDHVLRKHLQAGRLMRDGPGLAGSWPRPTCRASEAIPRPQRRRHAHHSQRGWCGHSGLHLLAISQRLLETEEIILIPHTDCGMPTFTDDGFKDAIQKTPASGRPGRPRPSLSWRRTSASPSHASRPIPSSSTKTPSADSSPTSPPAGSKRSSDVGRRRGGTCPALPVHNR